MATVRPRTLQSLQGSGALRAFKIVLAAITLRLEIATLWSAEVVSAAGVLAVLAFSRSLRVAAASLAAFSPVPG